MAMFMVPKAITTIKPIRLFDDRPHQRPVVFEIRLSLKKSCLEVLSGKR